MNVNIANNCKNPIVGLGIDIIDVRRVEFIYKKYGLNFCKKILGNNEYNEFMQRLNRNYLKSIKFIASRFSAKESFYKAIKIGMPTLSWHNIQIMNTSIGAPIMKLNSQLNDWFNQRYGNIHISISDESQFVITCVVIEKKY
ncbi:Holo-[acyl-carrier-protein] synthase [Candidatus Kinetoplastibacterium sorsogonicusi]|uniref:Holo-[acyl-carrier-protein] synthase n=1 Tax=Candidatus Kinetoplastidibacterium kentomonadis TaxID=1576550 RepID=A0A3Q8ETI7_9PROT|nr:holo-ACP synthase [Candidatus Kinetoplastibacterium sorsogonicusi]AWD32308.1 Holo-[acyl-carrier-protein] synthase [Candidatus Kinetoplastibacterium sorsogonicusi]